MRIRNLIYGLFVGLLLACPLLATDVYFEAVGNLEWMPTSATISTFTLSTSGDKIACCFIEQKARTITKIGVYVGTKTGTGGTYQVSIQGVSSQAPDGTIKGGASPASKTFTPGSDNTWEWVTLDNSYTTSLGEALSIVITDDTIDGSNYSSFGYRMNNAAYQSQPSTMYYTSSAWAVANYTPVLTVEYSDGTILKGTAALSSITNTASGWSNADTSDGTIQDLQRGNYWIPPQTSTIIGCWILMQDDANFDFKLNVFEGTDTTATTSTTITASTFFTKTSNLFPFYVPLDETSLTAGNTYRFVIEPTSANGCNAFELATFDSVTAKQYLIGDLSACSLSSAGTWTDDTSSVYGVIPVISTRTSSTSSSTSYLINPLNCRLWKNVASQSIYFYAYDFANNQPAMSITTSTITVNLSKDGAARSTITSPTISEIGSGWYVWTPSQENTNCDFMNVNFSVSSSTIKLADVNATTMPEVATVSEIGVDDIKGSSYQKNRDSLVQISRIVRGMRN